jgi:hypothetical protein
MFWKFGGFLPETVLPGIAKDLKHNKFIST